MAGKKRRSHYLEIDIEQDGPIRLDARFSCGHGEMIALVGPSGSGKSTILKTIAGLYQPRDGYVRVADQDWLDTPRKICLPAHRRLVGMVFQNYALFPHLSALSNVMEGMPHVPRSLRREKAAELLERANLAGLEDRLPAQLSGGQQQRVAVARALARDPLVLLLDEPFSAVDQVTREKLYEELAALRSKLAIPIVLVTHSLPEAFLLADKMCVLHHGKTLQMGAPMDVMHKPVSVEVARLVAIKNIFRGRLVDHPTRNTRAIQWGSATLEVDAGSHFRTGETVDWVIPESHIVMHRTGRPSGQHKSNSVAGTVTSAIALGSVMHIKMKPDWPGAMTVSFSVPANFARVNGVISGMRIAVSLLKSGIHPMKCGAAP